MDHKDIKDIIEEELKQEVAREIATDDSLEEADIEDLGKLDGVDQVEDETEEDENLVSKAIKDAKEQDTELPEDDVAEVEEDAAEPAAKKGLFTKKAKKDKREEKIEELNDQLIRRMAEFENFRKRSEKEKSQMYDMGAKSVIEKLLPVVDNFERGLALIPEDQQDNPVKEGMDLIYKQLMTMLSDTGVQAIEAVGQTFNPDLHNAVMHVEDENEGEHVVVEEFQKGYTYRDAVVRYSMVKVAN